MVRPCALFSMTDLRIFNTPVMTVERASLIAASFASAPELQVLRAPYRWLRTGIGEFALPFNPVNIGSVEVLQLTWISVTAGKLCPRLVTEMPQRASR